LLAVVEQAICQAVEQVAYDQLLLQQVAVVH
jgi:hypothetical protein